GGVEARDGAVRLIGEVPAHAVLVLEVEVERNVVVAWRSLAPPAPAGRPFPRGHREQPARPAEQVGPVVPRAHPGALHAEKGEPAQHRELLLLRDRIPMDEERRVPQHIHPPPPLIAAPLPVPPAGGGVLPGRTSRHCRIPVVATPSMIWRWKRKNSAVSGRDAIAETAINAGKF